MSGQDWAELANCRGVDPDVFYPERGGDHRAPKQVCAGCVVRDACLDHALRRRERFGIWGGLTESERRPARRAQRQEAASG